MSELTTNDLKQLERNYKQDPRADVVARAIMENGIKNVAKDPTAKQRLNRVFSIELKTGKVANQKRSGRCWMFALLNTLKEKVAKKYKIKNFELSQNYIFFWDKIERANIFYDRMIATADRSTEDRTVDFYLGMPDEDGGQWAMAAALIEKYGVVPKSSFPETKVTNDTIDFNEVLGLKLRRDGMKLRHMVQDGTSDEDIKAARRQMLSEVYRIIAYSCGIPPERFNFEYKDKDNKYHIDKGLTPKSFYDKYINVDLEDYVVATNSPDKKLNQLYSLPSQDNVVGGKHIELLNLPMETLKNAAIKQLKDNEPVWFGNDVLHQMDRKEGLLDSKLYRNAELFGINLDMSKADRLRYHEAEVTHAMVLTGVDFVDNKPVRWKVENSWGEKNGEKGYFVMNDDWMNKYVYELVVHKKYLSEDQQKLAQESPIALKPWDSLQ